MSKWQSKCPKCSTEYPKPPRNWDCPKCSVKTWQPDDDSNNCTVCNTVVAKFSRHHCRNCGMITCTACTNYTMIIPDWGVPEKQRVCKKCALPSAPCTMEGSLQKLAQRRGILGEKFQQRYFELHGQALLYFKEKGGQLGGQIDLEGAKVMDVAIHPNAFCLVGPRLLRGYVLSAHDTESKRLWIDALQTAVSSGTRPDGTAVDEDPEEGETEVIFNHDESRTGQSVSMSDFEIQTVLGLGSFGRVMKVKERRTGLILAMKVLDKAQIVANRMETHTQAEKSILADIKHPFICRLHYAFQTRKHLVLVLDFLSGGELFFHLQRCKRFSENRARLYAAEIGLALEYIHSKNIIYRDLKPENLVLDKEGHITLTDFGLAKRDVVTQTHTFCGTPEYMAPELIQKKGHSKAVDWWSLGIFIFEMVHGLPPFYTQNVSDMYDLILNKPLNFPSNFSAELRSLLSKLLERDASKRMQSGEEFRAHPFFSSINWERLYNREIRPEFVPDITGNDLKYFDKQFTQESTNVAQLDLPADPSDKKFAGFDYNHMSPTSPKPASAEESSPPPPASKSPDVDL